MTNITPENENNAAYNLDDPDVTNETDTSGQQKGFHLTPKAPVIVAAALLSSTLILLGVSAALTLPSRAQESNSNTIESNQNIFCEEFPNGVKKPVIYLYPESETDVDVALDIQHGELTFTYPKYNDDGWHITATPEGTLLDQMGNQYNYLYWEGEMNVKWDFSKGFCVKGEDTAEFLEQALNELGLTRKEANEFIIYWLPMMEDNKYNIISFQTSLYTDNAELNISPQPDTVIRILMAWKESDTPVDIEPQKLSAPERNGFTVVEWGGSEVVEYK